MSIAAILQGKGSDVVQVEADASILSVVKLLAEKRIGCVPVLEDGQVVGMFSERDLLYALAEQGPEVLESPVSAFMTSPAMTISPDVDTIGALSLMTRRRVRHLPVVREEAMIGLVSIGDLVKFRMDRIEAEAAAMREYIQSV